MQTVQQTLIAGAINSFGIPGSYFRLFAGTGVNVEFFRNGASIGNALTVDAGFYYRAPEDFDRVTITDPTGQVVKFAIADGEIGAASAVSVSGTVAVSHPGGTVTQTTTTTGADAQILAADSARQFLRLQNNGSVDIYLTFDGSAASATKIKLAPGASEIYDIFVPRGAVRAYSASAGSLVTVVA